MRRVSDWADPASYADQLSGNEQGPLGEPTNCRPPIWTAGNAIGLKNVILTGTVIGDGIADDSAGEKSATASQLAYYYKAYAHIISIYI